MYSVNRRTFLSAGASAALVACGGGGGDAEPEVQQFDTPGLAEAYAKRGQPVFGFNLYDFAGNTVADQNIQSMHYLGSCTYLYQMPDGSHVFRIVSERGTPLFVFDVTPGDGHWYRLELVSEFAGSVFYAYIRSSAGASARVVAFGPGAPRSVGQFGMEVYGPSGPGSTEANSGVVYSTLAGPLMADQIADFPFTAQQIVGSSAPEWAAGYLFDEQPHAVSSSRVGVIGSGLAYVALSGNGTLHSFNTCAFRVQTTQVQRVVGPVYPVFNVPQQAASIFRPAESVLLIDLNRYL